MRELIEPEIATRLEEMAIRDRVEGLRLYRLTATTTIDYYVVAESVEEAEKADFAEEAYPDMGFVQWGCTASKVTALEQVPGDDQGCCAYESIGDREDNYRSIKEWWEQECADTLKREEEAVIRSRHPALPLEAA